MPCSLYDNNIGPEGAAHIGAALKDNTALQTLEYVAPWPPRAICEFSGALKKPVRFSHLVLPCLQSQRERNRRRGC